MEDPIQGQAVPSGADSALSPDAAARKEEAAEYLRSLLNKNLQVHASDGRMFRGEFMCTDPDRNIVLAHSYEYRHPTAKEVAEQAAAAGVNADKIVANMTSRYLGLIVVPGQHIVKIEVEQFLSQMR